MESKRISVLLKLMMITVQAAAHASEENPTAELVRGKTGRPQALMSFTTMRNLVYNADMQEDKELAFDAMGYYKRLHYCLTVCWNQMKKDNTERGAKTDLPNATDAADYLCE